MTSSGSSGHGLRRLLAVLILLTAVPPLLAQVRSIDQRLLKEPPFYHTFSKRAPAPVGRILVLPVRPYDGPGGSPLFHEDAGLATIAAAISERLAALDFVQRADGPPLPAAHWPAIMLGDEEIVTGEPRQAGNRRSALAVTNPSRDWKRALQPVLQAAGADHVIVLSLGLSELYLRQDLRGRKTLSIGTGYRVPIAWMNDLESTVGVLTLSGALYDASGRLIRAGSEGIIAGRPSFWQGVLAKTITGGRGRITTIGDADDPQTVLAAHRREDLPGAPLAWEVALDNLLSQLLQRGDLRVPPN
jgi:hypothetical protein